MTSKYDEQDNDWANDIKEEPIHISQAKSGANGYYCMGCNKEMQAVKGSKRIHYFRHHAKDIEHNQIECVHSSREYREKLAYFYFMRVKKIKVPAVYKYPPKGVDGVPSLLREAITISAHRIDREVTFFEDENGEIKWGKKTKVDERYLMIRPDAVFFDKNDNPILFLEFVISHKPDIDKLNKLQRLGINTVQIIVPKLSEPELEKSISQASKVKWTYNEIESNTEYISIPTGNTEGIPSIDEEQRKLFEESYKCRAAQVSNLIRAVEKCLRSKLYRDTKYLFEQEISRIERTTKEHRSRLDEIQRGIEEEICGELEPRRGILEQAETGFQEYYSDLETRYSKKRWQLIEEQRDIDREIEFRLGIGRTKEDIRKEYKHQEDSIAAEERSCGYEEERINQQIESNREFENNFNRKENELEQEFERLKNEFEREFEKLENEERESFKNRRTNTKSQNDHHRELQNNEESGIRSEFERLYQQIDERFNNRDVQGGDDFSQRLKTILELRGLFGSYTNGKKTLERYRKGITFIRNGTWKEWDK